MKKMLFYALNILSFFTPALYPGEEEVVTFHKSIDSYDVADESLKIAVHMESLNEHAHVCISKVLQGLTQGNQISYSIVESKKEAGNAPFYLSFKATPTTLIWQLYNLQEKKYMEGKEYRLTKKTRALTRALCQDIWTALFGSPTPFDALLGYVKKDKSSSSPLSEIVLSSPLLQDPSRRILRSTRPILDLSSVNAKNTSFLVYSEATTHNVRLLKLNPNGIIIPLVDKKGSSGGFTASPDLCEAFYVRSGIIYRYFYNPLDQTAHHIPFLSKPLPCSAPILTENHTLFYAYAGKIYECTYNPENSSIRSSSAITKHKGYAISPTYSPHTQTIVYTQKINNYLQLVSFDMLTHKTEILTYSPYHKQDPSLSPCGTYVAYVAYDHETHSHKIEIMNMYTHKVIAVSSNQEDCYYPCWLINPV